MIVQALFWFHPIIWLTGAKLVFERELACDEAVLEAVKNPRVYAEGIIKVCENYIKSPMVCVSGVIGSNLKKRMEGIMKNQIGHKLSLVKRLFLSAAGLSILGIPLLIGIINALPGKAYSSDIDPDKMYVDEQRLDTYQGSGNSESINTHYEIINEKNNKNISGNNESLYMSENGQKYNQEKDAGFETNKNSRSFKVSSDEAKTPSPESFKIARNNCSPE